MLWRQEQGRPPGFSALQAHRPVVALGAEEPLEDQTLLGDYFHGMDGLGGIHASHPHLTPTETWEHLFDPSADPNILKPVPTGIATSSFAHQSFIPSRRLAHEEILQTLRENEPGTVTLIAIGPMTNLALAAAADPETFLRTKEVVVMGGAIGQPGNVTPVSEFNAYTDAVAAARVFALTSPMPASTLPPSSSAEPLYPSKLSKELKLRLFPVDITDRHSITKGQFQRTVSPFLEAGSPLAEWVGAFMAHAFRKLESTGLGHESDKVSLSLHDPMCAWYALTADDARWRPTSASPEDIRIETSGQWTRGMCIVDRRSRQRIDSEVESSGDHGLWLSTRAGNRILRMEGSPGEDEFGGILMEKIFA